MRILVTGATGFIGQARVRYLLHKGHDVIAIGRTHQNNGFPIQHYADISQKDSLKQIVARYFPERIEHFASQATVSVSRADPYGTYQDNVLGAVNILQNAVDIGVKELLVFTTDKYYGDLPVATEDDKPIITGGAYETSKFCQDIVAQSYRKNGLSVAIARSCNVYGPNDYNRRIVPNTLRSLQEGKQPVIFTNIRGVRQYIFIKDVVEAVDFIMNNGAGDTFNIGTDIHLSQEEVVKEMCSLWNEQHGSSIEPVYKLGPEMNEIPDQYLVWSKLHEKGWHPRYTFRDGLMEMM